MTRPTRRRRETATTAQDPGEDAEEPRPALPGQIDPAAPVTLVRGRDGALRAEQPARTPSVVPVPEPAVVTAEDLEAAHHWDARIWHMTGPR